MTNYPHRPAAFINAIAEEGTKADAVEWLQKTWNELCAVRGKLTPANNNRDTAADINAFVALTHGASASAGWWNDPATGEDLRHNPYVIGTKIGLIHSEVSEAMEGHRKGAMDDHLPHRKSIEVELADAMIRIGDMAGVLGLDLGGAIVEKMAYNARRADHRVANRAAAGGKVY